MSVKNNLKKITPDFVKRVARAVIHRPGCRAFSQEGEDLVLASLFGFSDFNTTPGYYVDVGAFDPRKYSNTYYFYRHGWRGINIDARPHSMDSFNRIRPRDRNIEAAISSTRAALTYYEFNAPALNGFDPDLSRARGEDHRFRVVSTRLIQTRTLAEILAAELPKGQRVDFLSVDVEGLDLEVLKSLDWTTVKPSVVLVPIQA